MNFILIAIAVALNIIIILRKFKAKRYEDGIFDSILLTLVTVIFMGSYAGLVVGTIASLLVSIYLWASPPQFFSGKNGLFHKFKKELEEEYSAAKKRNS